VLTFRTRKRDHPLSLYRWEFRLTLKIIVKTLREVVNRVKFGHQYTRRRSGGEVQSRVVRRRDRDRSRDRDRDRDRDRHRDRDRDRDRENDRDTVT